MMPISRRAFVATVAVASISFVPSAHAVDALPDARFVGLAETVNVFQLKSGQLALSKSSNELVRGYATRAVAEYPSAQQSLTRNSSEAGVSKALDEEVRKITDDSMNRLNALQGADFDKAYADAQVRLQTAAVAQLGAYSENGKSAPLRRYAQEVLPKSKEFLEYAKRVAGGQ
jgi:putative membrane protein